MRIERPVNVSVPTPFRLSEPSTTRAAPRPGRMKPPVRTPAASNNCTRSRPLGASATAKLPLMATSNALGSITRPSSAPICTSWRLVRPVVIDAVHRVRAPIEDVVVAVGGLLEADRFAEQPDDVGGQRADRPQDLDATR